MEGMDDIVEVFARVLLSEKPTHRIYNSGGVAISLGEIADIVRTYLPDAKIKFEKAEIAQVGWDQVL